MRKVAGLLFILTVAAIANAGLALLPDLPPLSEESFRAGWPGGTLGEPAASRPERAEAQAKSDMSATAPQVDQPARVVEAYPPEPEVVSLPRRNAVPTGGSPAPLPQRPSPVPGDRTALARELQRELRRVGCYDGDLNGNWTPTTRKAMKAFIDRINAGLPTEEPDFILLRLVQDHQARACGAECPAGEALAADGRCLPNAVLAAKRQQQAAGAPAPMQKAPVPMLSGPDALSPASTLDGATAGSNAPGQPAPLAAVAPPAGKAVDPAKRGAAQRPVFGPALFRTFDKVGH